MEGEFAIVEFFGHTTMVGRITEVERFGAKMLALEPLFRGELLTPVYHGGASIYRLTPCSFEVASARQPQDTWQLPPTIRAVVPVELLPEPMPAPEDKLMPNDRGEQFAPIDDDEPF